MPSPYELFVERSERLRYAESLRIEEAEHLEYSRPTIREHSPRESEAIRTPTKKEVRQTFKNLRHQQEEWKAYLQEAKKLCKGFVVSGPQIDFNAARWWGALVVSFNIEGQSGVVEAKFGLNVGSNISFGFSTGSSHLDRLLYALILDYLTPQAIGWLKRLGQHLQMTTIEED